MIIITGADHTHARSLRQMVASVKRHEPDVSLIVYDLGLTDYQRWLLTRRHPKLDLRRFPFERYPAHLNIRINTGVYAWKPVIVWDVLKSAQEPVCWMDAGVFLMQPLTALRAAVRRAGFYSPRSPGTIADWTHPKMLAYFGLDEAWRIGKPNLRGGCVAFDPGSRAALALAKRWQEGALDKGCIAPEGSDRNNHRQDQALLTVLAHLAGLAQTSEPECLGFLTQQDAEWTRRNLRGNLRRMMFPRGTPLLLKRALFFLR